MRLAISLLLLVLIGAGGCTSFLTETNPEKPWTHSRYRDLHRQDVHRLQGEDRTPSTVGQMVSYVPRKAWSGVEWVWNISTGHTAIKYTKELFHRNPDTRRHGVYVLSDQRYGRGVPYTDYYAVMAADDIDPTVRAAAIRALNRSRSSAQTAIYIAQLGDEKEMVRLEAAKALANIPDPKGVIPMMKLLSDEMQTRDVRIACADALRCYKQSDVAQALIRVLSDRDFGVAWQARRSLNLMTAKDFRYDQAAWLGHLTLTTSPFADF